MPNRLASVLSVAAWLAASAAAGQPVSAPAADEGSATVSRLTIHGAPKPTVIRKQAYRFVQAYAAAPDPNIDQIGRWTGPVCAEVWGLPLAEQAAKIKARIESMAQTVGLPAPRAGCKVNVEIVFTDQPQGMMDIVARRWEPLLGYYHQQRTIKLKTVTHPIQAWYSTATASVGVDFAAVFSGLPTSLVPTSTVVVDDPQAKAPAGCLDRFTSCYKSRFHNVLIVADSKALEGEPLGLIADAMVMLALSQPRSLDGCGPLPSVLDRFARSPCPGRDPPRGLTPADAAYLTALYAANLEGKMFVEQTDIAGRMAAILIKASAAGAGSTDARPDDLKAR